MSSPQQQMAHPQQQPQPQPPAECSGLPVCDEDVDADPQVKWNEQTASYHCEVCGNSTDHQLDTGEYIGRGCYVGYCPDEETRKNEAEEDARRASLTEYERNVEDRNEFPHDDDNWYY